MARLKVGQENTAPIEIHYEDLGKGRPVVLIHGWPLSGASWEKQTQALLGAGFRVITYDRRGFGQSSQPSVGYDYDTFTADLDRLMTALDLRDAALVGFSMGTGEVARYLSKHGSERVRRAVMIGVVPPFLLKTPDNPDGIEQSMFDGIQASILADRPAFLKQFLANFYSSDTLLGKRLSEELIQTSWNVAVGASAKGTHDCVKAWLTDFREDLKRIDVRTVVIHGDDDRILPIDKTGARIKEFVKGSRLAVIPGGPHGLLWTHAAEVNKELLEFLAE